MREPAARDNRDKDRGILKVSAPERFAESRVRRKQPREYKLWRRHAPPIPSFTGLVEPAEEGKIGIACSGGGIRSAAFCLGALQVLQEKKKLQQATYLAGVSGGSYIAAAFSMVRRTWPVDAAETANTDDSDPGAVNADHPPFFPGSPEEQYLRNRSSYLAPGAFGKIQFGHRLLLGMAINFLFVVFATVTIAVPLALLYGGIYPRLAAHVGRMGLCARLTHGTLPGNPQDALCRFDPLHIPFALWFGLVVLAALALLAGASSMLAYHWRGQKAEAIQVWSLRALLVVGSLAFLLIGLPVLLSLVRALGAATSASVSTAAAIAHTQTRGASEVSPTTAIAAGAGGTATLAGAVLLQLRADWNEAKVVAGDVGKAREWFAKLSPRLRLLLAYMIAAIVGPALTLLVALMAMTFALNLPRVWEPWALAGLLASLFALAYYFADLTTWSLHSFYRRRLCSAFALKRVRFNDFPAIASTDTGVALERDYHHPVRLSQTAVPEEDGCERWPTLLVCASANVSDDAATPPGRAVTSFTFSATAMGGPLVGAVSTQALEDGCDEDRRAYFTLPAAVAMSGAALSPSMGKMTRWPLRFLMALANVRLGVWVPNPRRLRLPPAGESVEPSQFPRPRPLYLLRELLGINTVNSQYLYVTDGGHYENLGLVELLRRGCTEIYVFDASNDDFGAVGDAVSLARSELDVKVKLDYSTLRPDEQSGLSATDCVPAQIEFPDEPDMRANLYYARLTMTADAPADAVAYRGQDERFPHDPTTDQLYTDQRFEAYRALGAHAARTALQRSSGAAPPD